MTILMVYQLLPVYKVTVHSQDPLIVKANPGLTLNGGLRKNSRQKIILNAVEDRQIQSTFPNLLRYFLCIISVIFATGPVRWALFAN